MAKLSYVVAGVVVAAVIIAVVLFSAQPSTGPVEPPIVEPPIVEPNNSSTLENPATVILNSTDVDKIIDEKIAKILNNTKNAENSTSNYDPTRPRDWITSGPFQIDRKQYAIGENIFVRVVGLAPDAKGDMVFLRPFNDTHYSVYITLPFDGAKPVFNQYFTPDLVYKQRVCSIDDIAGDWIVVFRGTQHSNLGFTISGDIIVPGEEPEYEPVC